MNKTSYSWIKQFALLTLVALFCLALVLGAALSCANRSASDAFADAGDAAVTNVTLEAVSGYTLQDDYWRNSVGDYAFVQGMSAVEAINRIGKVNVEYSDNTVKSFTVGSEATITLSSVNTDSDIVTFDVSVTDGGDVITAQASLNFIQYKPYALVLTGSVSTIGEQLKTTTPFAEYKDLLTNKVSLRYTNGDQAPLEDTRFLTTDETLVPSADKFSDLITNPQPYSKTISVYYSSMGNTVIDTSVKPFQLLVEDIEFVKVSSISGLSGSLANQTARTEFQYDGLSFFVMFEDGNFNSIPIVDFKEYLTVRYFINNVEQPQGSQITMAVNKIVIDWSIPSGGVNPITGSRTFEGRAISIYQTIKNLPSMSDLNPTYSKDGCTVVLSQLEQDENNTISVQVTGPGSPSATLEGLDYNIVFDQGGVYVVKVILDKGASGDYTWVRAIGNPCRDENDEYTLIYSITVDNAPIELNLTYTSANREYGDDEPTRQVEMSYKDGDVIGNLNKGAVADDTSERGMPSYDLRYFGWTGADGTVYTEENPSSVAPKALGSYSVYAVTGKTALYQAGKSNVVAFNITERVISVSQMNTTATFADKHFKLEDIVKLNSSGRPVFAYDDTTTDVLSLTSNPNDIYHVGSYDITLALTSGKGANYTFGSNASLKFTFTVTAASLSFTINNFQSSFQYGDTVPTTWSDFTQTNLKGWVTINSAPKFYKIVNGVSTEVTAAQPWDIGNYKVVYGTSAKSAPNTVGTPNTDYNLPTAEATFTITPRTINAISISDSGWSATSSGAGEIGVYGSNVTATLGNWDSITNGNVMPSGTGNIVSVAIKYVCFGETTDNAVAFGGTKTLTLQNAGNYVVTVSLNANYVWASSDNTINGTHNDIVYYGYISKAEISSLDISSSDGIIYNGNARTPQVTFAYNGGSASWHKDYITATQSILTISGVSGLRFDNSTAITVGAADILNDVGKFNVTQAGVYTATIVITDKNNYKWSDNSATDKTLQYTISQAALGATWTWTTTQFNPALTAQPTPTCAITACNSDATKITVTTGLYVKSTGISVSSITSSGDFIIRIVSHSSTDDTALNYYIPVNDGVSALEKEFTIAPLALDPVTLTNGTSAVAVTYKGSAYKFADYIANYGGENANKIEWLVIAVDTLSGNNPDIVNVKLSGTQVVAYTVTVSPADSYEWDTTKGGVTDKKEAMQFTFTVSKLAVKLNWGSTTSTTYGQTPSASATVTNRGTDNVTVTVGYKNASGGELSVVPTSAGNYFVYAKSLNGAQSGNYAIDADAQDANVQVNYVIYKQGIAKPSVTKVNATYNGSPRNATFTGNALLSATITAVRPKEWFTPAEANDVAFNSGATISCANGIATLTDAGKYSATFTVTDGANYCWLGDDYNTEKINFTNNYYTYTTDLGTIDRAEKTAPALGKLRAMQKDDGVSSAFDALFISDGFTAQYGSRLNSDLSATRQDVNSEGNATIIGQYYVLLTVSEAQKFNYKWVVNYDSDDGKSFEGSQYLDGNPVSVITFTTDNGAQVILSYAITASQVNISYNIENYIFGANAVGYYNGTSFTVNGNVHDLEKFLVLQGYDEYENLDGANIASREVKFYKKNASGEASATALADGELVNGLPWLAGNYVVEIAIEFGKPDVYQNWSKTYDFTVNPLLVEVKWSDVDSATYNGSGQTRQATVTNVPQKETNGTDGVPTLTVSKVTNVKWTNHAVAPNTVTITAVSDSVNYTINGLTNHSANFTINPKNISVTAQNVTAHVYGDSITSSEKVCSLTSGIDNNQLCGTDTLASVVKVAILTSDNSAVTNLTPVDTYRVVPQLVNAEGNYSLTVIEGTFEIVKRQIEIVINDDNNGNTLATSVYGQAPLNLMTDGIYTVTTSNGSGSGIPAGATVANVFALTTTVTSSSAISTDTNKYYVSCNLIDTTNYALTNASDFGENGYEYVVTPAKITDISIVGYNGVYDAQDHNILSTSKAATVDGSNLTWLYSSNGTDWTSYATTNSGVAFSGEAAKRARDVQTSNYYIKVQAANHEDYIYQNSDSQPQTVEVKITPATLTVSVNLAIYYGEESPLNYDGSNIYQADVASLRNAKLIGNAVGDAVDGSIYTVSGLYSADVDGFRNETTFVGGTISYGFKNSAYNKGDAANSNYALTVNVDGVTCANYAFVASDSNALVVNPLPISVVINNYTAKFNQAAPTVPTVSSVKTAYKSSYRTGATIAIYDAANVVPDVVSKITNPALDTKVTGSTTNKAGEYNITITLTSNYVLDATAANGGYKTAKYTIEKADNKINTPNYSLFTGAYSSKDDGTLQGNAAWVYGDYSSEHTNGYNPAGNHSLMTLSMLFWGTADVNLQVTLKGPHAECVGTMVGLRANQTSTERMNAFQGIFNTERANGHFVAGKYTVTLHMDATDNYNAFNETWYFTVDKQQLTIKPTNLSVTYGNALTEITTGLVSEKYYAYKVDGLVANKGNGTLDALNSIVTFKLTSTYQAGKTNGSVKTNGYAITATDVSGSTLQLVDGKYESSNYVITFANAAVTVIARPITVQVKNLTNHYDLIGYTDNAYFQEDAQQYQFRLVSGSFAQCDLADGVTVALNVDVELVSQTVFDLTSAALTSADGHKTNNQAEYSISLTQNKNANGLDNYDITVQTATNYAGKFTIKPAQLYLAIDRIPYKDAACEDQYTTTAADALEYDGITKYFKESQNSLPDFATDLTSVPGTMAYYKSGAAANEWTLLTEAPKNVGYYYVVFVPESDNYECSIARYEYDITRRLINTSSVITNANGVVNSANGYYFNGGAYVQTLTFARVVDGESINLSFALDTTVQGYNATTMSKDRSEALGTNSYTFSARNAGVYKVTLTLVDGGEGNGFKASNYRFDMSGSSAHSFTLTVDKATLKIATTTATVQYGALLTTSRFSGFVPVYSIHFGNTLMNDADNAVRNLLNDEINKDFYYKNASSKTADEGGMYTSNYGVSNMTWGKTYNLAFDKSLLNAYNFVVETDGNNKLSVIKRDITVTVKGYTDGVDEASCIYSGQGESHDHNVCLQNTLNNSGIKAKFFDINYGDGFTQPSDFNGEPILTKLDLRISRLSRNANKINMAASSTSERYNVKFVNTSGVEITNNLEDSNLPKYAILPKTLTIAVSAVGYEDSINKTANTFVYPYGTSFTDSNGNQIKGSMLILRFYGFADGEGNEAGQFDVSNNNVTVTGYSIADYTPWVSEYNGKHKVSLVVDNQNGNYTIAYANDNLQVGQLTLTATSHSVVYNNGAIDGNNGKYGAALPLNLTYAYGSNIALPGNAKPVVINSIEYSTTANDASSAKLAPTKVGNYTAKVTLPANGNYKLTTANVGDTNYVHTFEHIVTPLQIAFGWQKDSVDIDMTESNVTTFYNTLIDIISFNNTQGSIKDSGMYSVDTTANTLTITPTLVGRYELTVDFNSNAVRNYLWPDNTNSTYVVSFSVITSDKSVTLDFTVDDITYGGTFNSTTTLTTAHGTVLEDPVITYTFAVYNKTVTADTDRKIATSEGATITGYNHLFPQDAGWYVARAYYAGETDGYGAASAYYLFQIKKVVVDKPTLNIITSGDGKNDVYTGYRLDASVEYSALNVFISNYRESYDITTTGATLHALNAGNYYVTFVLINSTNYSWNGDIADDNDVTVTTNDNGDITSVTLAWTISAATDNGIMFDGENAYSVTYGDDYVIKATAKYAPDSVTIAYASKGSYATAQDVPANVWTTETSSAAGNYYIRVTSAATSNYNGAVAYEQLTINKREIEIVVNGSMTYGDNFANATYTRQIIGLVSGDTADAIKPVEGKSLKYLFVGDDNTAQLSAGIYGVILEADANGIVGLTSSNYVLKPRQGVLTVNAKTITVVIGNNSQSVYNDEVVLTNTISTKFSDDLVSWDKTNGIDVLNIKLATDADKGSNVDLYTVYAESYNNDNYEVTFENGIHTIVALQVSVVIAEGGGEYGGKIVGAKVERIETVNSVNNRSLEIDTLGFTYRYTGKTNGQVDYSDSKLPTLAGTYIATVTGIVDNANYSLDLTAGDLSVTFVISKKIIDADNLEVPSKPFTGEAIKPTVIDNFYNVNGAKIYEVVEHADFIDRGTHTFKLKIVDFDNYKWQSVDIAEKEVQFVITKAQNALVSNAPDDKPTITIKGWTYGRFNPDVNLPEAFVKYGQGEILFTYSTERDGEYTTGIPANGDAGEYWVRVTVLETDNYARFDSEPVMFVIEKMTLTAPTLVIDESNSVYTGERLNAAVIGFNSLTMDYSYAETATRDGSTLTITALTAGVYQIKIILTQGANYRWTDGTTCDEQGNAVLTWTITRQKVAKPQDDTRKLVVNGQLLTYLPIGFDDSIMTITDNQVGYGGEFTAHVALKDTANYEWEDGTTDTLDYVWTVVGAHTVFIVIICSLAAGSAALAVVAVVQYMRYRKKKYADVKEEFGDETFTPDKAKQTKSTNEEVDQ